MFWPSRSVAASLLDDPSAKRNNHPDLFGDRNEFAGRHQTARRMMPSQQRLAAGYGLGPGINLRLIIEFELPVDDRAPHVVLKKAPLLKPRVHRGLEKTAGVASVRFGAVHRGARAAACSGPPISLCNTTNSHPRGTSRWPHGHARCLQIARARSPRSSICVTWA